MLAMGMMLGSRPVYDITLPSNRSQWIRSVDATQIPSSIPVLLILRIASGIQIQSTSTAVAAIVLDSLAQGSEVQIVNLGYVIGDGGNAGAGGIGGGAGQNGSAGGPAIRADYTGPLFITNALGNIWGGGGGGGGGGGDFVWNVVDTAYDAHSGGGGGGGGAGGGALGAGGAAGSGAGAAAGTNGTAGSTGSLGAAGSAGAGGDATAGNGGAGGAYGSAGTTGGTGGRHGGGPGGAAVAGGTGGAAGYAVLHNSGTVVTFLSGSASPNVKGSVGT